ncbi:ImmA/IrrE family metallo-endopeptidase [Clostridium oryzae]|uniref:IrrE N-terminal-like domain-containing protein n=1 Tax=Clostridium oryzae TaxID=1450648 RepID=A0A1V4IEU7_9CLOT|nr:ImmA/IrrE family metallo-endopeptidase [Clostridium oryzae]OPJ58449.1 hypothetical protein CLORY_35990 [Clostridium oryzae]
MEWIDDIVLGLVDEFNTNDVYELCDYLNISIRRLPSDNILLKDKAGFYYRDFEDNEAIFIKNGLHPSLERFVLSHELGHALCNTDLLNAAFSLCNKGKFEKQANYFAFKLNDINFDKVELDGMSLEQVATCVNVPYQALLQLIT